MSNGDDAMTSAEFAKLMGAYPEPAGNPLPSYGGFMDNSAANFAWVNNNDYFGAETKKGWTCKYCDHDLKTVIAHPQPEPLTLADEVCLRCGIQADYDGDLAKGWKVKNGAESAEESCSCGMDNCSNHTKWMPCAECGIRSKGISPNEGIIYCEPCSDINWKKEDIDGMREKINENYRFQKEHDKEFPFYETRHHLIDDVLRRTNSNRNSLSKWADTDLTPTDQMNNSIGQVVPVTNPMELPTNLIEVQAGGGPEGQINGIPAAEYYAEMDVVADGMSVISNINDDVVGVVEVMDDKDDDELVELSIQDENMEEIGSFTLDDGEIFDDEDDYRSNFGAETKPSMVTLIGGIGVGILAYMNRERLWGAAKSVFNADNQEVLENDPELVENPNTGQLDPAAYEELVVESTGYALDIIPMSLDGSFMGSRFAALPTERYVDYNDPGIGAHTDIAMNRDENFLEPEMAMVQAAEGDTVVKETQAPGQSPYLSIDGQEPADMNYRVIKETHPVSLDPAVKPFIPQSMAGYTGNKNTPPSVYNKMFNIGVLGQTPLFTPQDAEDIGASRAGSRRAKPNILGLNGSVGGPLSDKVNANYTDGATSMSLAQWAQENTVSQSSDTEAVVIDRSSGAMKRVRRV